MRENRKNKGIIIKTPQEIEGIRISSRLAAQVLNHIEPYMQAGVSTLELDHICNTFILANGGKSACINYHGYPKYTCISRNDVICHGIPAANDLLKNGDIVNVDITTIVDGYFGDTSRMFLIGNVSDNARKLVQVTRECLEL